MARWQPARDDVIAEYAREVLEVHPSGRIVVGLDGIEDPAGTAPSAREAFATDLAAALVGAGVPAAAVPLGLFAAEPRSTDPERFYDEARFRSQVLTPYRREGVFAVSEPTDDGWATRGYELPERAVLVVSGPFLHFPALAGIWHTSAWLQIGRAEASEHDAARLPGVDPAPWTALVDLAFRRLDARKPANASFDLTDPAHPRRVFEDAC
jgi:uridine kinase